MASSADSAREIVWDITDELIDPDHLAQACTRIQKRIKNQGWWKRHPKLLIAGAVALVIDLIAGLAGSNWIFGFLIAYFMLVVVVAGLWNRHVTAQTARHLRDYPLTFPTSVITASAEGIRTVASDSESRDAWRVFDSVWVQDGLIVLVRTPNLMQPLPNTALKTDLAPADVLKLLKWWIAASKSESVAHSTT